MPRNILIVESAMSKDLCRRIIERFEEDPQRTLSQEMIMRCAIEFN